LQWNTVLKSSEVGLKISWIPVVLAVYIAVIQRPHTGLSHAANLALFGIYLAK
jgi:hypothetical protein